MSASDPMSSGARICRAPFTSMYLTPEGDVRACCQNVWQPLGSVKDATLRELWSGPEADRLRRRMAIGDLSLGCELCAVEVEAGAPGNAHLKVFEHLADPARLDWPRQIELALSAACNLQCVMCNGDLSSAIRIHREGRPPMSRPYDDAFFEQLDEFLPHVERLTFLGGEPLLGSEPMRVLERVIELGLRPTCHVMTNGTQWNGRVERILRHLPAHVAVSVDGATAATNEAIRVGVDHHRLQQNIVALREAALSGGGGMSIAFSLMVVNARELPDVLAWGDRLDADVVINTVTNPPRYSLYHLSGPELAPLVADLKARAAACERDLGRNLATWRSTLERVVQLARRAPQEPQLEGRALQAAAAAAEAWTDEGPVVTMEVGPDQLIREIDPDAGNVFGADVRAAVGGSAIEFMRRLGPHLGTLAETSLKFGGDGVERRTFAFDREGLRPHLLAVMAPLAEGERWFFRLRDDAVGSPVAVRSSRPAGRHYTPPEALSSGSTAPTGRDDEVGPAWRGVGGRGVGTARER